MVIPRGFARPEALDASVQDAIAELGPDVIRVRYSPGEDWTCDPSIFFRVVLSDRSTRNDRLLRTIQRVSSHIRERLEPVEEWGLLAYFDYRSKSEQDELQEKAWA
jgi:hypothetical protein